MALPNPFRRGQPGAWISGAVHGAVLLALLVGFSSEKLPDAEEGIPVEMITENQLSEMTKGEKAAAKPQPNAKPRADRVAETRVEKDPGEAKRDAPSPPKRPQEAKLADEEQEAPPPAPPVRVAEAKPEPVPAPPARPEPDRAAEARAAAEAKAAAAEAKAAADAKAAAAAEARAAAQAKAAAKAAAEARAEAEAEKLAEKQEAEALEKARVAAAKLKQEAEARAKAEAETRAKALAKAKADADAKAEAKAELDAKLKTLADADAKAAAQAERQKLAEAKAQADAKAAADAKAQADAKAHADAKAKALAQAKAKADADAKARKQAELADRFSPGDISKLLASKEPSQSTGATARDVQRTASLGTATGASQRLNPSQRDQLIGLLQDQLHGCWQVPIAAQTADKPPVPSIRLKLNPDGTLAAEPAVMNTSGDPLFRAVADSATRAARRCAPLRIPAQFAPFYNDWRDLVVNFDPRAMG